MLNRYGGNVAGGQLAIGNGGDYLAGSNEALTGDQMYQMGMMINEAGLGLDSMTGGALGGLQQAALYPGKLFAQTLLGNTEAGKQWIDFVDDTFTIQGQQRKRAANARGIEAAPSADELAVGGGLLELTDGTEGMKRQKIDETTSVNTGDTAVKREIKQNGLMKRMVGKIFQAPRGFRRRKQNNVGRIDSTVTPALRMKQISDASVLAQSY